MKRLTAVLVLATLACGAVWAFQRPDQPNRPFPPGGGTTQISASGKFVYILRGDDVLQFDAASLEFVKKVKLPPQDRNDREPPDRARPPRDQDK